MKVYNSSGVLKTYNEMLVGSAVLNGGANRILYEDASQVLSASANLLFDGSSLALGAALNSLNAITLTKSGSVNGTCGILMTVQQNGLSGFYTTHGIDITVTHNAASSNTSNIMAGSFVAGNVAGATTATIYGISGTAQSVSGATATKLVGLDYAAYALGTATTVKSVQTISGVAGASASVTNNYGWHHTVYNITSGANITTNYGIAFRDWIISGGTTTGTNYLIYADTTTNIGTNKWGLYFLPDMPSYHVGKFGIGTGVTAPSARLQVRDTTEQFRAEYDGSNYMSLTVGSTGGITLAATGSGAQFTFSNNVGFPGGATFRGYTSSAAAPTTTELPNDKDFCIHKDTAGVAWYLAFNAAGVIKTATLA
jgi:hypothetical protein